jgi:hypothetical protein
MLSSRLPCSGKLKKLTGDQRRNGGEAEAE